MCAAVFVQVIRRKGKRRQRSLSILRPRKTDETNDASHSIVQLALVLPMSKWQMTTSQAVSIRLNSVACGRFTLVDSYILFFENTAVHI